MSWAKIIRIVSNIVWQAAKAEHVGVWELVCVGFAILYSGQHKHYDLAETLDVTAIPSEEEPSVRHVVFTSYGLRTYCRVLIEKTLNRTKSWCSQNCIETLRVGTFDSDVSYEPGTREPLPIRA